MRKAALRWLGLACVMTTACTMGFVGCGGSNGGQNESSGGDSGAGDATADSPTGSDAGDDTTTGSDTGTEAGSDDGSSGEASSDAGSSEASTADASDGGSTSDASGDGGASDAATDSGVTDGATDAATDGGDASTGCTTDSQCPQGQICGLTQPGVCSACSTDTQCQSDTATYGSGYICVGGACTAGNCHADTDCPQGQICGVTQAYYCGKCTTDTQCKNDSHYGSGYVCDTGSGACVQNTCTTVNQTCSLNSSDECCAVNGSDVCVAGNCCTNTQCSGGTPACEGYTCTACDVVSGPPYHYYVNPNTGSDGLGTTGSGTAAGQPNAVCAFKTIHGALAYVATKFPTGAPAGTEVVVQGPSTVSNGTNGETFPIDVPANILITGDGTPITVDVQSGVDGFVLAAANSGLAQLTVDGQTTATNGVHAATGSASTTIVTGVTLQHFASNGILVDGTGALTVNGGTQANGNAQNGLYVTGSATAAISGGTLGAPTAFDDNTAAGILVDQSAAIALTGTPGTAGNGTVVANGNANGLLVEQALIVVGSGVFPPQNTIDGLVVWHSTADGIVLLGGSTVKMRKSYVLNNANSGVSVKANPGQTTGMSGDYYGNIDLGNSTNNDWGLNIVQSTTSSNGYSGICFQPVGNQTLNAMGNTFDGSDCSLSTSMSVTLTKSGGSCGTNVDLGVSGAANIVTTYCKN